MRLHIRKYSQDQIIPIKVFSDDTVCDVNRFWNFQSCHLTRARPEVWATFARPGGGADDRPPPENSKTKEDSDKR